MQTQHYADATDFFAIFEEGDLDEQLQQGRVCEGYVWVGEERKLAVKFVYDDDTQTSGTGTWDDELL